MISQPQLLPAQILVPGAAPPVLTMTLPAAAPSDHDLRITRITHSSVLIEYGGDAILTDPWFSQRGGFPGYYSGESVALGIDALPSLSGVLGSMDHYDHFDIQTFAEYRDRSVPVVVPAGTAQRAAADKAGFTDVRELGPWGELELGACNPAGSSTRSFKITAVSTKPEQPTDSFEYEHAYVIEVAGRRLLYCSHLMTEAVQREVAQRFPGGFDVAFVAVNGLHRKMNNRKLSMSPTDAAELCETLRVRLAVPIHYAFHGGWVSSAFIISHHGTPEAFIDAAMQRAPRTTVMVLAPGQRLELGFGFEARRADRATELRQSVLEFFRRLSEGDLGAFELFAPGFVHHRPLPGANDGSRQAARGAMQKLREAIPDMRLEVEHVVVEGEAVGVRVRAFGNATGSIPGAPGLAGPVSRTVTMLYLFDGKQIAQEWIDDDTTTPWSAAGGLK